MSLSIWHFTPTEWLEYKRGYEDGKFDETTGVDCIPRFPNVAFAEGYLAGRARVAAEKEEGKA